MNQTFIAAELVWPIAYIMAGFLIGLILEAVLYTQQKRLSASPTWEGVGRVLHAFRGSVGLWATLAGAYAAINNVTMPIRLLALLQRLTLIAAILSVTFVISQVAVGVIRWYARTAEGAARATSILTNLSRIVIFLIGAMIVLDSLGISVMPALTALGVAGLAVALALQTTLANLFAGLQILASKQIRLGDYVRLDSGEEGYVSDIAWRTTALRTPAETVIFIPNSKLAAAVITNYNLPDRPVSVLVQVDVKPTADLATVEKAVVEIATSVMKDVPEGIPDFQPYAHYGVLSDTSRTLIVTLKVKAFRDRFSVRDEFIRRLSTRFAQEGVLKSVAGVEKMP